jgi:hypothetical protein
MPGHPATDDVREHARRHMAEVLAFNPNRHTGKASKATDTTTKSVGPITIAEFQC